MKLKFNYFIIIIILLLLGVNNYLIAKKDNFQKLKTETATSTKKNENIISMMLETEARSGKYEMTTHDNWPTEGYIFNAELSKCEHGGDLSWDGNNKIVVMMGNTSDKCYVYFDKEEENIQFYLNDILFQAKSSMTWEEWLNSYYSDSWKYKGKTITYDEAVNLNNDNKSCLPQDNDGYYIYDTYGYVLLIFTSISYKTDNLSDYKSNVGIIIGRNHLISDDLEKSNSQLYLHGGYEEDTKDNYYYVEAATNGSGCY